MGQDRFRQPAKDTQTLAERLRCWSVIQRKAVIFLSSVTLERPSSIPNPRIESSDGTNWANWLSLCKQNAVGSLLVPERLAAGSRQPGEEAGGRRPPQRNLLHRRVLTKDGWLPRRNLQSTFKERRAGRTEDRRRASVASGLASTVTHVAPVVSLRPPDSIGSFLPAYIFISM